MLLEIWHHKDRASEWAEVSAVRMTGPSTAQIFLSDPNQVWFLLASPTRVHENENRWVYHATISIQTNEKLEGVLTAIRHDLGFKEIFLPFKLHLT
ncbi:MAG: hypothetical protein AAB372_00350 [Patescibacteria group bacterium]